MPAGLEDEVKSGFEKFPLPRDLDINMAFSGQCLRILLQIFQRYSLHILHHGRQSLIIRPF